MSYKTHRVPSVPMVNPLLDPMAKVNADTKRMLSEAIVKSPYAYFEREVRKRNICMVCNDPNCGWRGQV